MPEQIRTERLVLRTPTVEDSDAIYEEYAADLEVTRYLTWSRHDSRDTVAEFLTELLDREQVGKEHPWVLTLASGRRPIGMVTARLEGHKADIGYVLGRRHWKHGFMTEAVVAVVQHLLNNPEIVRVWAVCDVENIGSARVLEKSGFAREGVLRKWIMHPNRSTEPRDCYVYGRVK